MSKIRQKQNKRRSEIIEKAMPLLETTPFEEISIQDICKAADISVGSFYHYFNRKTDLLVGLMELIDVYMEERVFPHLAGGNELEKLKIISRGFAAYIAESGIEQSKLITSCCPTDLDVNNEKRPLWLKLEEIVAQGQQKGEFKVVYSPEKTADLLLIAMSGVAVDWSRRDGNYAITTRMEEFTALFFPALMHKED